MVCSSLFFLFKGSFLNIENKFSFLIAKIYHFFHRVIIIISSKNNYGPVRNFHLLLIFSFCGKFQTYISFSLIHLDEFNIEKFSLKCFLEIKLNQPIFKYFLHPLKMDTLGASSRAFL